MSGSPCPGGRVSHLHDPDFDRGDRTAYRSGLNSGSELAQC